MRNQYSDLSKELINAYKKTNYEVFTEQPFTLNIDIFSERLSLIYKENSVETACFITAYNPFSEKLTLEDNKAVQEKLLQNIIHSGNQFFEGIGVDPKGEWKGEPSFLILGISKEEAIEIGKQFKQNALVWCNKNCIPQLILLR